MALPATDIGTPHIASGSIPQTWARILPHFKMRLPQQLCSGGEAGPTSVRVAEFCSRQLYQSLAMITFSDSERVRE
jgi:hypothetical protein